MRRLNFIKLLSGLFFSFLLLAPLRAESPKSDEFPQDLEGDLSGGTTALYHLQFKEAEEKFRHAIEARPEHPAPYFFLTMLRWYELSYDSLLYQNSSLEKALMDQASLTVKVAKKFSRDKSSQSSGFLYWAGALGAKGWYHRTRSQWVRAYFSGKKGYNLLQKTIDLKPELYDAYLGIGMYEYYAATLGPFLKVLASFSVRGDKDRALQYLNLAQSKSKYVRFEAAYFLWNAALEERNLGEAVRRAQELEHFFPHSPLFRWCKIQTLFYQKDWAAVLRECDEYIAESKKAQNGKNNTFFLLLSKVHYHQGAALFSLGKIDEAPLYFEKCLEDKTPFAGWKVMSLLRLGELRDLKGNRSEAERAYREVLNLPDYWDSHSKARKRLSEPFKPTTSLEDVMTSPLQTWNSDLN